MVLSSLPGPHAVSPRRPPACGRHTGHASARAGYKYRHYPYTRRTFPYFSAQQVRKYGHKVRISSHEACKTRIFRHRGRPRRTARGRPRRPPAHTILYIRTRAEARAPARGAAPARPPGYRDARRRPGAGATKKSVSRSGNPERETEVCTMGPGNSGRGADDRPRHAPRHRGDRLISSGGRGVRASFSRGRCRNRSHSRNRRSCSRAWSRSR